MRTIHTLLIVVLIALFVALLGLRREAFGMSPGTLTQLESTHVPTMEDVRAARREVREENREIAAMTGSPLF
jgi:hypothetical protein